MIFADGMVANGWRGEPILAPLKNSQQLWDVLFYTQFDNGYVIGEFLPVKLKWNLSTQESTKYIFHKIVFQRTNCNIYLFFRLIYWFTMVSHMRLNYTKCACDYDHNRYAERQWRRFQKFNSPRPVHGRFVPFEHSFYALFLGGIWDNLAKLLGHSQANEEPKNPKKLNCCEQQQIYAKLILSLCDFDSIYFYQKVLLFHADIKFQLHLFIDELI